jgi:RNA recognition motif-containing protein
LFTKKKKSFIQEFFLTILKEMTDEMKKLKKQQEMDQLYMREERKLFLGGLSPDTVEKDLRKHFTQFGQIVDVQVMRDKEAGVSRGFGFVTFACTFMAEAAVEHEEHILNDIKITPQFATQDVPRYRGNF